MHELYMRGFIYLYWNPVVDLLKCPQFVLITKSTIYEMVVGSCIWNLVL